ncbi:beta-microseminoprotein [Molossus molossus]|uniref:Beta-microseminoprotein n=1 Tax=Molossus molossus TaxID=27622 RepID=A0A7J8DQF0_MOLMO|nr:beta-microseminoprotein [Molossus molossus]KAF6425363.1 microseminoprotein beta [Molossus molossus]
MNALLGSLVVLATFVTLCNAQCMFIPRTYVPGDLSNECTDANGVKHALKSTWKTEDCKECSCGPDGVHCCSTVAVPKDYDISKCKKIFDKDNCKFIVVEQENPDRHCVVSKWVL